MRNYKLTIEYNGLNFNGWQKQKNTRNTIQDQIEISINRLLRTEIKLTGAGRTDTKVSALNQVANFLYEEKIDLNKFLHSLNSILPDEITIKKISLVPLNFHSRYSAIKREYIYKITTVKRSVCSDFHYRINYDPDFKKIDSFIEEIKNLKNFYSFCKNKSDLRNFSCLIYVFKYQIHKSKNEIIFTISANRFLHSMVRSLIGCALEIGRGKTDLNEVLKKVKKGEKIRVYYIPGNALLLNKINY
ncbi:MAG TPA: tRNA pseudouridine(38-40) synthase TruA [Ignavibacteria bacterium]|nr:tRNA pseudouridine(38-40) synthase TruA [Ignavibacteria bacterium]